MTLYSVWKRFLVSILSFILSISAFAQAEGQIAVGYSGREVAKSSDWGLDSEGVISAAIKLDPTRLNALTGVKVCGVSAGLASRLNVESVSVWVRSSLDGENLAETSGTAKKGWNDFVFSAPCAIDGTECFVGYTLTLSDASYPVSVVSGESEYGFFLNSGEGWIVPQCDEPSVLSLLAIVEADNLAKYDLAIIGAELPSRMKIGDSSAISLTFENKGCRTVTGANIKFYENGVESDIYTVDCAIAPGEKATAQIEYEPLGDSKISGCPLEIVIESLAEGPDENAADNSWLAEFDLCKFDFTKRVFIEEFTTQLCSNCPRAARMLHALLEMPEYAGKVVVCARHSGFGTDFFTSDVDLKMLEMYGNDGTFCPAIMLDRTAFYSNGVPVISVPGDLSELVALVKRCLDKEASVDIDATAQYDEASGKVRVKVFGGRDGEFGNTPARISVYLVENDIRDTRQQGADGEYYQQHVVRAADTVWGAEIQWDADDEFSYECLLDPAKVRDIANTEIVVAVHDHDSADISNRTVNNSFSTKDIEWGNYGTNGCGDAVFDGSAAIEYYDLQGRKVDSIDGFSGILVKKTVYSDGSSFTEKIAL